MRTLALVLALALSLSATLHPASAEPGATTPFVTTSLADHGGVHLLRLGGGVRFGTLLLRLLVDPLAVLDRVHTTDATVDVELARGIAVRAGWRDTAIAAGGGVRFYDSLLVGTNLPLLGRPGDFELCAAAGVAKLIVAHGDGMPARWAASTTVDAYSVELGLEARYAF